MKRLLNRIPVTLLLSGLFATTTLAQTSAQEIAANLRVQLIEVQVSMAEMQARDEQLQEDLKPENIERSSGWYRQYTSGTIARTAAAATGDCKDTCTCPAR